MRIAKCITLFHASKPIDDIILGAENVNKRGEQEDESNYLCLTVPWLSSLTGKFFHLAACEAARTYTVFIASVRIISFPTRIRENRGFFLGLHTHSLWWLSYRGDGARGK